MLQELDVRPLQLTRDRIQARHRERDVVDGPSSRRSGGPSLVLHGQQPDIAHAQTVELPPQLSRLATEPLLIPLQGRGRVGAAQMDMVEAERVAVLDQFDAGAPRVEDESVFEQARRVA